MLLVLAALAMVGLVYMVEQTKMGRAMRAPAENPRVAGLMGVDANREDEIAAKAMGINTRNTKLLAFAMGASFGGVAGSMFAVFHGFVSPESFSLTERHAAGVQGRRPDRV